MKRKIVRKRNIRHCVSIGDCCLLKNVKAFYSPCDPQSHYLHLWWSNVLLVTLHKLWISRNQEAGMESGNRQMPDEDYYIILNAN